MAGNALACVQTRLRSWGRVGLRADAFAWLGTRWPACGLADVARDALLACE